MFAVQKFVLSHLNFKNNGHAFIKSKLVLMGRNGENQRTFRIDILNLQARVQRRKQCIVPQELFFSFRGRALAL